MTFLNHITVGVLYFFLCGGINFFGTLIFLFGKVSSNKLTYL